MTKNQVIEKAKNSNEMELLLFKTNNKTKKVQLIKHSCLTLDQLEQLVEQLMINEFEHSYKIEIA
jgi:hypothetical protein